MVVSDKQSSAQCCQKRDFLGNGCEVVRLDFKGVIAMHLFCMHIKSCQSCHVRDLCWNVDNTVAIQ